MSTAFMAEAERCEEELRGGGSWIVDRGLVSPQGEFGGTEVPHDIPRVRRSGIDEPSCGRSCAHPVWMSKDAVLEVAHRLLGPRPHRGRS